MKECKLVPGVKCTHKSQDNCATKCNSLEAYAIGVVRTAKDIVNMIGHYAPDGSLFNLQQLIKEKFFLTPKEPEQEVVDGPVKDPIIDTPTPPLRVMDVDSKEVKK
ncbi:MAG: hypothetical protein KBT06_04305 [Prevotellaceae bacterium]|nr:hypothetical protein [Candidatus Colivivens equi]